MRGLRTIAVLFSIGLAAAGCVAGDAAPPTDDAQDIRSSEASVRYEAELQKVHADMNEAMSRAFSTRDLDPSAVRTARNSAREAIEWMEVADPPKRFAVAHSQYLAGLETFAEILESVERRIAEPNVARQHLQDARFSTGVQHLERASKLYAKAGLVLDASAAT